MGTATSILKFIRFAAVMVIAVVVSGCVASDTLSSVNTQSTPQPLASNTAPATIQPASLTIEGSASESVDYDPAQRAQAVAEIRAKAASANSGIPTNAFVDADGPNRPLSAEEQAERIATLEKDATQNNATITDAELVEKQRSIRELQRKAQTHYSSAINTIKN